MLMAIKDQRVVIMMAMRDWKKRFQLRIFAITKLMSIQLVLGVNWISVEKLFNRDTDMQILDTEFDTKF